MGVEKVERVEKVEGVERVGRCGWWIDLPPVESLDSALREACGADGVRALPEMGARGHQLIERKYTWAAVCKPMVHGYEQMLNSCEFAPCDTCRNYGDTCPIK